MTSTELQSIDEEQIEEKEKNVNIAVIITTIVLCVLLVYFITNIKVIKKYTSIDSGIPFKNTLLIVAISLLIGVIGLFNSYFMTMVGDQLRPILVFMTLTSTLLFTKFASDNSDITISKDTFSSKDNLKNASDGILMFIKTNSKLYDFILFNTFIFLVIIVHVIINKYLKMDKKYIELVQQLFTLFIFAILLGYYKYYKSNDSSFIYVIICLIIFYMFRIFHKLDYITKLGINKKYVDLSALDFDNIQFLKYIQMVFNGLFLIKFFS